MSNKFEQLLELLINEENEKAEALFHEIVVEKSRDIYEGLADETTATEAKEESKEEAVEETKDETVEETTEESKDEEANEGEEVQIEDEKTEEETIEEVGGDATDELVKDIAADEKVMLKQPQTTWKKTWKLMQKKATLKREWLI
jgi:hypothetical protein